MVNAVEWDESEPAFLDWDASDLPTGKEMPSAYRVSLWNMEFCAICGREGYTLVDHDHTTHLTRGMLCRSCNVREGRGAGGPFKAWREGVNPGQMHGLAEEYWSAFTVQHHLPPSDSEVLRKGAEATGRIG